MKSIIVYHAPCLDGIGAAWAIAQGLPDDVVPVLMPRAHNEPLPPASVFADADVYVVDFSFPEDYMHAILAQCNRLVWLDHHATEEKKMANVAATLNASLGHVIQYDVAKSGARLAYEYAFPGEDLPWLLAYIEDWDLWAKKLPYCDEINLALGTRSWDFAMLDELVTSPAAYAQLVDEGIVLSRQQNRVLDDLMKLAAPVTLNGIAGLSVNAPRRFADMLGERLAKRSQTFGLVWYQDASRAYCYSVRGTGNLHCGELAQCFGGGGHRNASGFSTLNPVH